MTRLTACQFPSSLGLRIIPSCPIAEILAYACRTDPEANAHKPSTAIGLATFGTLSLEFTRLSQITGNPKYFDAVQRIANELDKWQYNTVLPGMWPTMVNTALEDGDMAIGSPTQGGEESFSLGALADSTYEYLPKVRIGSDFREMMAQSH